MSDELKCPLCYKDYYSHECPHNFNQMVQNIDALRVQLDETVICRDHWKISYEKAMKIYRDIRREQFALIDERDLLKAKLEQANKLIAELSAEIDELDGTKHQMEIEDGTLC